MAKDLIKPTRGLSSEMNNLQANEIGFATDTKQLFIGTGDGAEAVLIEGKQGKQGEKGSDAQVTTENVISALSEKSYATPVQIGRWLDGKPVYRVYYEEEINTEGAMFSRVGDSDTFRCPTFDLVKKQLLYDSPEEVKVINMTAVIYSKDEGGGNSAGGIIDVGLPGRTNFDERYLCLDLSDYLLSGIKNTCYGHIDFSCYAGYVTGEWDFGNVALDDLEDWYYPTWDCNDLSFLQVGKKITFTVTDKQILTKDFAIHIQNSNTHYLNIHHTENFEKGHVYTAVITVAPGTDELIDGEATVVTVA